MGLVLISLLVFLVFFVCGHFKTFLFFLPVPLLPSSLFSVWTVCIITEMLVLLSSSEFMNIQLFSVAKTYHSALSKVDVSAYTEGKRQSYRLMLQSGELFYSHPPTPFVCFVFVFVSLLF